MDFFKSQMDFLVYIIRNLQGIPVFNITYLFAQKTLTTYPCEMSCLMILRFSILPDLRKFYVCNSISKIATLTHLSCMHTIIQVQAIGMYGAAQPDFFKSETNGGIKNIISYHLKIIKRYVFSPNLEAVAPKISLPRS